MTVHLGETRKSTERLMFKQLEMAHAMEDFAKKISSHAEAEVMQPHSVLCPGVA